MIADFIQGRFSYTQYAKEKNNRMWVPQQKSAPAENRTRGPTMATSDFTTKPLVLSGLFDQFIMYNHTHALLLDVVLVATRYYYLYHPPAAGS